MKIFEYSAAFVLLLTYAAFGSTLDPDKDRFIEWVASVFAVVSGIGVMIFLFFYVKIIVFNK